VMVFSFGIFLFRLYRSYFFARRPKVTINEVHS